MDSAMRTIWTTKSLAVPCAKIHHHQHNPERVSSFQDEIQPKHRQDLHSILVVPNSFLFFRNVTRHHKVGAYTLRFPGTVKPEFQEPNCT